MKKFAFVFPGQGSQSVGMLDGWGKEPVVLETLSQASDALGQDLGDLIKNGSKEALALTTNTQPVMLVAGVCAYRVWLAQGGAKPDVLAGHSLGEYAALVAAGSLQLKDAVPLVRFRAQAMQEAVPVGAGAMAAILGLEAQRVIDVCLDVTRSYDAQALESVEAVNFNDPTQTVIAGSKAAVEKACEALKAAGAKRALKLPVSAPFHSSLMRPAAEKLKAKLLSINFAAPQIAVVNNIDVAQVSTPEALRDALVRQAFGPVRWVEVVKHIQAMGVDTIVECGPGKVLSGLVKRIDSGLTSACLQDQASLQEVKNIFSQA